MSNISPDVNTNDENKQYSENMKQSLLSRWFESGLNYVREDSKNRHAARDYTKEDLHRRKKYFTTN
jgi:hypothetical protein